MKVKDVIEIVESHGYTLDRIRGDHRQYKKAGCRTITIPGKLSADMPIGTEKSIMRQIRGT